MKPRRRTRHVEGLDAIHEDSESSVCTNDDMFTVESGPPIHHSEAKPDKRNQLVFFSRSIVIIVLLLSAVAISLPTYFVLCQDEQDDFENKVRTPSCSIDGSYSVDYGSFSSSRRN